MPNLAHAPRVIERFGRGKYYDGTRRVSRIGPLRESPYTPPNPTATTPVRDRRDDARPIEVRFPRSTVSQGQARRAVAINQEVAVGGT